MFSAEALHDDLQLSVPLSGELFANGGLVLFQLHPEFVVGEALGFVRFFSETLLQLQKLLLMLLCGLSQPGLCILDGSLAFCSFCSQGFTKLGL